MESQIREMLDDPKHFSSLKLIFASAIFDRGSDGDAQKEHSPLLCDE